MDRAFANAEKSGAKAATGLEAAGRRISTAGSKISSAGKNITKYGSLPVAALGAVAIKTAIDFEKSMRNVNSIAQLPEKQFQKLNREVLAMSGEMAQAPKTMAEGMYDLVSSGFDAKESLVVLRASAKAATAGLTTTEVSSKAVAASLNAYHRPAKEAGQVSDDLFETVNRGVVSFEELAGAIGYVLPAASTMGINIKEVGAAISTLTKEGQSGETAITNINQAVTAFIKPSKALNGTIKDLGYASGEQIIKQKGFQGALEAVTKAAHGNKEIIGEMFGNVRAMRAVFGLTGKSAASAREDVAAFNKDAGRTNQVLAEQKKSTAYQWKQLRAEAEVLAVTMGKDLIPIVREVGADVKDVVGAFMGLPKGTQKSIIEFGLITVAAGPVIRTLGAITSGIGSIVGVAAKLQNAKIGSSIASAISGSLADGKGSYELARSFGRGKLASSAAGFFSTSFAKYLGVGMAAVGVGNIVMSATKGDWKDAGFKAGGALVGGIAGAFLGPEGAMIGVGLGSIAGGILGSLFSGGPKVKSMQERLKESLEGTTKAIQAQKQAGHQLAQSQNSVASAHKRVKEATDHEKKAQNELDEVRRKSGPNSQATVRKEVALAEARDEVTRATRREKNAEHLHGEELKATKELQRVAILEERHRINVLKQQRVSLENQRQAMKAAGASVQELKPINEGYLKNLQHSQKAQGQYAKTLQEAAQTGGNKWAHFLRNATQSALDMGKKVNTSLSDIKRPIQNSVLGFQTFSKSAKRNFGSAKGDVKSFEGATTGSLNRTGTTLNTFLSALGVKSVAFGPPAPTGKQRGGGLGGAGTGDTIPAMLEPGEYVLNRNAVKTVGTSTLDHLNFSLAPRFQKGGPIGPEPKITGTEPLHMAGQHAVHKGFKAAVRYANQHDGIGRIVANGNRMDSLHQPYLWGGGHGSTASRNGPWDCSGGISELFDGSGLPGPNFNFAPMVSGGFQTWGLPGKGDVSVLANAEHVYAVVKGKGAIGTSDSNPGGGFGWISEYTFRPGFTIRHADFGATGGGFRGSGRHGKGQNQKKGFQSGGMVVSGKASYEGGTGHLTADQKHTDEDPGFAIRDDSTLGDWFWAKVGGAEGLLQHTDWGPAAWTGRAIDFTAAGLRKIGASLGITDTQATVEWAGHTAAAAAKNLGSSGGTKAKKLAIPKGHTVHGGTSAGTATPKEIKRATKLGAKHAKNPKISHNVPTSPLPSWAAALPLFQREELEGRGTTTPERETILANAESNATFSEGMAGRTLERAQAAYEENPTEANWQAVEAAALNVQLTRGGQALASNARKLFEKGVINHTTKGIKQINWKLAHAAGKLSGKQVKALKEKRAELVSQRAGAREGAQGASEALRGYGEENATEAADLAREQKEHREEEEEKRREARRDKGELSVAEAETTRGTKSDDLKALEGLKQIAEEELKEAKESGNLGDIAEATRNLTQATENLRNLAIEAFEEQTEGELALAELTEGLSDDLEILHRKLSFAEEELKKSEEEGNWAEIARWAHEVKGLTEAIKSDEGSESQAQLAEEMKALRESIEQQTNFAREAVATGSATAWKALADILSGQLGARATLQAQTVSNGGVGSF